jgi:hypothetical protein
MSRYFDFVQASKLVGQRIRTRIAWSGVPAGTTGRVVRADNSYTESGRHALVIRWDLPGRAKPLEDWFDEIEFQIRRRAVRGARPSVRSNHRHLEVLT